jgi:hypothetical protein
MAKKKKAPSPAQLVGARKLTKNERNWSFVLLAVTVGAVVIGVWYFMSNPNWDTNGNFAPVKPHVSVK